MDNNDNSFYTQPDANQAPEQPEQSYGQPEQQAYSQQPNQSYGQPEQQAYSQQPNQSYGQPEQQAYSQQPNQAYGQPNQAYNQAYGQYNQPQPNMYQPYGMNQAPMGTNGQPLKNNFGMKLTFSILEIISCNLITFIMGIIGCVFTTKANNSYKAGKWDEFKSQAKTASICLWVGLAGFLAGLVFMIALWGVIGDEFMKGFWEGYNGTSDAAVGVYVDNTYIGFPLEYSELEDLGFYIDSYYENTEVDAGDIDFVSAVNMYGEDVMWLWVENRTSSDADVTECTIVGIDVDYNCDNYETYSTAEGVNFSYTYDECVATLGTPDDTKTEDGQTTLYWYLDGGYNPTWRVMEITFDANGYIYDIDVDYK